jgi:WD40 repeat protein
VSPLLQYAMTTRHETASIEMTTTTTRIHDTNNDVLLPPPNHHDGRGLASLSPVGPRLVPPKGLGAIYSLQFLPEPLRPPNSTGNGNGKSSWLVAAGKAGMVALWDCPSSWTSSTLSSKSKFTSSSEEEEEQQAEEPQRMDPVLSWKAHGGRWIADARFVSGGPSTSSANTSTHSTSTPSRLLTAANDGCVCLWDLTTVSVQTGAPKTRPWPCRPCWQTRRLRPCGGPTIIRPR